MNLTILYRGTLASCNYDCCYCPFAKQKDSLAQLTYDRLALERFVNWIERHTEHQFSILFTPWGEALIHRAYQDALMRLSHATNVEKVAIQTNLSCSLDWLTDCDRKRLALWASFHPSQVSREKFLAKCRKLDRQGIRYSVGMVGLKEYADEMTVLRQRLAPEVYFWVNAYKDEADYYAPGDIQKITEVDPLFGINLTNHASLGRACQAGQTVIAVDSEGLMRRCHFIPQPIGNLYDEGFEAALVKRLCVNHTCDCHIGYVHLDNLGLYKTFAGGVLERIPAQKIWQR
jgi:MoaA/NifB/PqqE/SkfB family radical SAM enzyme